MTVLPLLSTVAPEAVVEELLSWLVYLQRSVVLLQLGVVIGVPLHTTVSTPWDWMKIPPSAAPISATGSAVATPDSGTSASVPPSVSGKSSSPTRRDPDPASM